MVFLRLDLSNGNCSLSLSILYCYSIASMFLYQELDYA